MQEYRFNDLLLPLPSPLCMRILKQIHSNPLMNESIGCQRGMGNGFALRCNWRITVNVNNSSNTSNNLSSPPPPPLSLATLFSVLHFIVNSFPFTSAQDCVNGLARVVALWPHLSEQSRAPTEPLAPIHSVSIDAQLIKPLAGPNAPALMELHAERYANQCCMLGQDTFNTWGDVDILLEVPTPAAVVAAASGSIAASTATPDSIHLGDAEEESAAAEPDAPSAGLYCLNIRPGQRIPLHIHPALVESEFMLSLGAAPNQSKGLTCQDECVRVGDIHQWCGDAQPHHYSNLTGTYVARILCIDVPRFERHHETEIDINSLPPGTKLARSVQDRGAPWRELLKGSKTSFAFPGGLSNQQVTLITDPSSFKSPHAVVTFVFKTDDSSSVSAASSSQQHPHQPSLLFVHHRNRGWELPGGTVEDGEDGATAAVREIREEAEISIPLTQMKLIAQYHIEEQGQPLYVKSVYVTRTTLNDGGLKSKTPQRETDAAEWISPPPQWSEVIAKPVGVNDASTRSFSDILHDNVYPVCLELSFASLQLQCESSQTNSASSSVATSASAFSTAAAAAVGAAAASSPPLSISPPDGGISASTTGAAAAIAPAPPAEIVYTSAEEAAAAADAERLSSDLSIPLSELFKDGSRGAHKSAERSLFLKDLFAGRLSIIQYAAFLRRLHQVYSTLEQIGAELTSTGKSPLGSSVIDPSLARVPALENDLDILTPNWRMDHATTPLISPAASAYCARIRSVTSKWSPLYVSHHYTRYLGDLSGGQIMSKILSRHGYNNNQLNFYKFDTLGMNGNEYKQAYRNKLDQIGNGMNAQERKRMLEEVNMAFALNEALFDELAPSPY
jgi:heme oxygenase/8-oxo-dGTP pyrophosphatase MutT (NUDIX family)